MTGPVRAVGACASYHYRDPLELPACSPAELATTGPARVYIEPPGTKRHFARAAPSFLDDPDGVGLFRPFAADQIVMPPIFIAAASAVRLTGFRTVLCPQGFFFTDDANLGREREAFLARLQTEPIAESAGLVPSRDTPGEFCWEPAGRQVRHIDGSVVLLTSAEPANFASFLFRVLPKLRSLEHTDLASSKFLVYLGHDVFKGLLELAGLDAAGTQIIHHDWAMAYELDHVVVPCLRNNQAFLDPESREMFDRLRRRFGGPPQRGMRIYVSRLGFPGYHGRIMRNELALIARLAALGFTIVSPEKLSASEKIRVFSSAELVVGGSGAGLFNTVFCHPGTRVIDIESEPHWIHASRSLLASCGHEYGIFVGRALDRRFQVHHQPWEVNIPALVARIAAFAPA